MTTVRYLTHPQVRIDPKLDVRQWSLSELGLERVTALIGAGALTGIRHVFSSAETKATETAQPIADALGCAVNVRKGQHENDRSATGYLPPDMFEKVADQFFNSPDLSVKGWETASAAQARIVAEVDECLSGPIFGDVLFVGHGAVGTLLYCALAGLPISRQHDQPIGGGCYFAFDLAERRPFAPWRRMETMVI